MVSSQQHLFAVEEIKTSRHRNRKDHNQYFTPEFAVEEALSFIHETKIENIIDPAVGNAVFLKVASRKWSSANRFGIDIDEKIISKLKQLSWLGSVFICANSLLRETWELPELQGILSRGGFDLVVGNPPFSSWFNRIKSKEILSNYQLAKKNGRLTNSLGIEILFFEIFVNLTKENGFIVIVLPDGVLSNPQYRYVREFILKKTRVLKVINLPRNIFENTSAKTSILILQKMKTKGLEYSAEICALDRTGKISNTIKVRYDDLLKRMDYCYYYDLKNCSIRELIDNGFIFKPLRDFIVYFKTGKTLYGKQRKFYDKGLRFLHATNITEIGIDYKKDEKFIDPLSKMNFQDAYTRVGDILFVRVGVGCAGRVAIVDVKEDEGVATDYIHIFKVKDVNPYFLAVYLKTKFGKDSINLLRHGVGTVSINKTDVLSLPIPVLPEDVQRRIEKEYKIILSKYRRNGHSKKSIDQLTTLINSLEKELTYYRGMKCYVEV